MHDGERVIEFFHIPEGSSFLHSYQTLCAALIALFAAFLAYRGARYSANVEAERKRSIVLNYTDYISDTLKFDTDYYEAKTDEENEQFLYLQQFCNSISGYDVSVFENNYVECVRKAEQAPLIQLKMRLHKLQKSAEECSKDISKLHEGQIDDEYVERYCKMFNARGALFIRLSRIIIECAQGVVEIKNNNFRNKCSSLLKKARSFRFSPFGIRITSK